MVKRDDPDGRDADVADVVTRTDEIIGQMMTLVDDLRRNVGRLQMLNSEVRKPAGYS